MPPAWCTGGPGADVLILAAKAPTGLGGWARTALA